MWALYVVDQCALITHIAFTRSTSSLHFDTLYKKVITDKNIPIDDDADRVGAPHLSCLWSLQFIDSTRLRCKLSAVHGGYRKENGTINRSARWDVTGGYVYVHVRGENGLGVNKRAVFTFRQGACIVYWCRRSI